MGFYTGTTGREKFKRQNRENDLRVRGESRNFSM